MLHVSKPRISTAAAALVGLLTLEGCVVPSAEAEKRNSKSPITTSSMVREPLNTTSFQEPGTAISLTRADKDVLVSNLRTGQSTLMSCLMSESLEPGFLQTLTPLRLNKVQDRLGTVVEQLKEFVARPSMNVEISRPLAAVVVDLETFLSHLGTVKLPSEGANTKAHSGEASLGLVAWKSIHFAAESLKLEDPAFKVPVGIPEMQVANSADPHRGMHRFDNVFGIQGEEPSRPQIAKVQRPAQAESPNLEERIKIAQRDLEERVKARQIVEQKTLARQQPVAVVSSTPHKSAGQELLNGVRVGLVTVKGAEVAAGTFEIATTFGEVALTDGLAPAMEVVSAGFWETAADFFMLFLGL